MSTEEVKDFFKTLNLEEEAEILKKEEIDGSIFNTMTEDDLHKVGILKFGVAKC